MSMTVVGTVRLLRQMPVKPYFWSPRRWTQDTASSASSANPTQNVPGLSQTSSANPTQNVPGLSQSCFVPASEEVGPGASKSGDYKNPEYFCYHANSYFEAEIEMAKYRCPQPSSKKNTK